MITSRNKEQLGGLFIAAVSLWLTYSFWQGILEQARMHPDGLVTFFAPAAAGPAFAVFGIAMILFPTYRRERLERGEDISSLKGLQLLTLRWKIILAVALVVEVIYVYFLGLYPSF